MANNIWVLPEKYGYVVHFKSYQVVKDGRQVVSSSKWGLEEKVLWLIECLPLTVSHQLFMNNLFKIKTQQWYLDNGWSKRQQGSLHSSFLNLLNLTDLFGFWTKLNESITTKLIPLLQPEHGFCQQNGPVYGQVQDCYSKKKI